MQCYLPVLTKYFFKFRSSFVQIFDGFCYEKKVNTSEIISPHFVLTKAQHTFLFFSR